MYNTTQYRFYKLSTPSRNTVNVTNLSTTLINLQHNPKRYTSKPQTPFYLGKPLNHLAPPVRVLLRNRVGSQVVLNRVTLHQLIFALLVQNGAPIVHVPLLHIDAVPRLLLILPIVPKSVQRFLPKVGPVVGLHLLQA